MKLNFNHPTKELIWVVQPDDNVSDIAPWGKQWFNYTDSYDHTYDAAGVFGTGMNLDTYGSYGGSNGVVAESPTTAGTFGANNAQVAGLNFITPANHDAGSMPGIAAGGANNVFVPVSFEDGSNPVVWAKLQLNGHDRFSGRDGKYFNLVQPYQHHENVPSAGINLYSFGLKPEEHQPSGTCNFSRIDNATLQLSLSPLSVLSGRTVQIRVYAVNYNVLRIMSGMGGLALNQYLQKHGIEQKSYMQLKSGILQLINHYNTQAIHIFALFVASECVYAFARYLVAGNPLEPFLPSCYGKPSDGQE